MWGQKIKKYGGENKDSGDLLIHIDESWVDNQGIFLKGWLLYRNEPWEKVSVSIGDDSVPIVRWYDRPDVISAYPEYFQNLRCGFSVYIPHTAKNQVSFDVTGQTGSASGSMTVSGLPLQTSSYNNAGHLFTEFTEMVNRDHLRVLEIGSRIVSPGSTSKRSLFPGAESFTGFDIYPDENTDVVGDAHQLSRYFQKEAFDAIFSLSVFEHLAMPWLVAREINKTLKTGGITFHSSHFSWPLHETPWDFYRFSDEGFRSLFPPSMGYRIIKAGLFSPLRMYFDSVPSGVEELPLRSGFGGSALLAQKVSDVDETKFCWDTGLDEVLGKDSHYPVK